MCLELTTWVWITYQGSFPGVDRISFSYHASTHYLVVAWGDLHCHESPETGVVILWSNLGHCVLDMSTAPLPCKEKLYFIGNILILLCL